MAGIQAVRNIHEEMFAGIDKRASAKIGYPFPMRIAVPRGRSPRHPMFEYSREMGSGMLPDLMAGRPLVRPGTTKPVELLFMFPERHLEPWEQQCFNYLLAGNPSSDLFACVDVVTQSPLIVGDYVAEMIRITSWPDEEEEHKKYVESVGVRVKEALARSDSYRRCVEG